jgi:hypothetical protein
MDGLFREFSLSAVDREVGGWGRVHLIHRGEGIKRLSPYEPRREAISTSDVIPHADTTSWR